MQQILHDETAGKRQLYTTQSRQQKLKPIISEFGYYLTLAISLEAAHSISLYKSLPKGAKQFITSSGTGVQEGRVHVETALKSAF